jgi:oligosaccharide repeat unit polymerase
MGENVHAILICLFLGGMLAFLWYQYTHAEVLPVPACFWTSVAIAIIIFPLIFFPWAQMSVLALFWIAICAVSLFGGTKAAAWVRQRRQNTIVSPRDCYPGLARLIVVLSLIGVISLFIQFHMLGYGPAQVLFTKKLITIQPELKGWLKNAPSFVAVLSACFYAAAMLGGFYYAARLNTYWRFLAFVPFIPAVATAFFVTTKLSFLFPLSFWFGAYFAAMVYYHRPFTRQGTKRVLYVMVCSIALFLLLVVLRYTSSDPAGGKIYGGWDGFWIYVLSCVGGHITAFSLWFNDYLANASGQLGWGKYTFAGIFNYLGYGARVAPPEIAVIDLPAHLISQGSINSTTVYTIFRQIILDFGLVGSVLFFAATGFIAQWAYDMVKNGHILWITILTPFYCYTLWMFNTSIFNYNSIILAAFLFTCYFASLPYLSRIIPNRKREKK